MPSPSRPDVFDRRKEAVSATGQGFDETRTRCRIAERFANLVHRSIQTVIEIDEGVGAPDGLAEAFACNDLSGVLQQCNENLEGCSWRRMRAPFLRSSPASRSTSKTLNRKSLAHGWAMDRHDDAPVVYNRRKTAEFTAAETEDRAVLSGIVLSYFFSFFFSSFAHASLSATVR